jgi:hypothetical protein
VWRDTFDADYLEKYSSGGDTAAAWTVSGGKLIGTGGTQATLIKNDLFLQDCEIEINIDQADQGGIVARYQDGNNYYLLVVKDDSGPAPTQNIELYKRVNGSFIGLANADITFPRGTSKVVKFTLQGSALEAWFDSVKVISVTDTTYTGGSVGLRNNSTTASQYLDFKVYHVSRGVVVEEGTQNLALNGSFEYYTGANGIGDGWWDYASPGITASYAVDTTEHRASGSRSQKLAVTASTATGSANVFQTSIPVTPGQIYTVSGYFKGSLASGAAAYLILEYHDSSGAWLSGQTFAIGNINSVWKRVSGSLAAPANAVTAHIYFQVWISGIGATGTVYIDDVQLEAKAFSTSTIFASDVVTQKARNYETLTVPTDGIFTKGSWTVELNFTPTCNMNTSIIKPLWRCHIDDNNYYMLLVGYSGELYLQVLTNGVYYAVATANGFVSLGNTYSIMAIGDGSVMRLYANGVQIGSDTAYAEPVGSLPVTMGVGYDTRWGATANGIISNFRISNTVRTLAEYQKTYNSGFPLTVDDVTTYLMTMAGTLQPTVRKFGLWSGSGEIAGNIIRGSEIYGSQVRTTSQAGSNTYIELATDGNLNVVGATGSKVLNITAGYNQGRIALYDEGIQKGQLLVNATSTRDLLIRSSDGNGVQLSADTGESIRLGSCSGVTSDRGVKISGISEALLPYSHYAYNVGSSSKRWNYIYCYTLVQGDTAFEERECAICGQPFKPGDVLGLVVKAVHEELGTLTIPVHVGCKDKNAVLEVEIPEVESYFEMDDSGEVKEYKRTKYLEEDIPVVTVANGYRLDEKSGTFKKDPLIVKVAKDGYIARNTKQGVRFFEENTGKEINLNSILEDVEVFPEREVTREEAVISELHRRRTPVMKTITVKVGDDSN